MEKIVCTTSGEGWFFVHADINGWPTFSRIVVWATYESGETIGLVGVTNSEHRLVTPPPVEGSYIHWDELTEPQKEEAIKQSRPKVLKEHLNS